MSGLRITRLIHEGIDVPDAQSLDVTVSGDDVDFDSVPLDDGGLAWKAPVNFATTGNITIATALNAGDVIDGVTLVAGMRGLVKDQSTGSQNGIYVVDASPYRAEDLDEDDEVLGALVYVVAGTANAGTAWAVTNTTEPVVDTDAITWAAFGGMVNPMTTEDDIIVGGASGAPARLGKGTDGQVLTVDPTTHHLVWATPAGGSGAVATDAIWDAAGDLAVGSGSNTAARLAAGSEGDVLTIVSGVPAWAAAAGGGGGGRGEYADKYNPDHETPATTPAIAEECNGSIDGAWSWSAAPATADATDLPGYYLTKMTGTGEYWLSRPWTPGASDLTVACKLLIASGSATSTIMFGVADATGNPTNAVLATIQYGGAPTFTMYNKTTTFAQVGGGGNPGNIGRGVPLWLRLTRVIAGPTWTAYMSRDGVSWQPYGSTGTKALTVGALCLRIADNPHTVAVDWIRAWSSVIEKVGA